eukprot:TRINITY_DN2539_c0_g2_i5.p1 TRINITY_DN2539_c0_g2~~TRINITY_DN2539_c0_g2_i5.p1  ORF type:complete len:216 (+),score=24.55 TRINITY_DN2539_c0_g2_i5:43-648(+)
MCSKPVPVPLGTHVHPNIQPFVFLLGVWEGLGKGFYSTIAPFEYYESVSITSLGILRPLLKYEQFTWVCLIQIPFSCHKAAPEGKPLYEKPMHTETGFIRVLKSSPESDTKLEFCVTDPTGVTSIYVGQVETSSGHVTLDWSSSCVTCSGLAKNVTVLNRRWIFSTSTTPATWSYNLYMEAVGQVCLLFRSLGIVFVTRQF